MSRNHCFLKLSHLNFSSFLSRMDNDECCSGQSEGYTLVELLMALVVASVVLAAAGILLTDFLKYSKRIEAGQTARESANRLNYLVQIEASEAREIDSNWTSVKYNGTAVSECGFSSGDSPLFSLVVPEKEGAYGTAGVAAPVYYYAKDGDLRRCGPQTLANGELVASVDGVTKPPYVDGIVMRDVALNVVKATDATCGASITDSKTLVYTLKFDGIGWIPSCVVARAKTVYVCNQPSAAMIADANLPVTDPDYAPLPTGSCTP